MFKQVFDHNLQKETPNPWITPDSWLTKTDITYPVQFGGFTVQSRLYNIDVVGYNNRTTKLRLFDIERWMRALSEIPLILTKMTLQKSDLIPVSGRFR